MHAFLCPYTYTRLKEVVENADKYRCSGGVAEEQHKF